MQVSTNIDDTLKLLIKLNLIGEQTIEYMKAIKHKNSQADETFLVELRTRVNNHFKTIGIHKFATRTAIVKAIILFIIYVTLNICLFMTNTLAQMMLVYMLIGISSIFVALNIAHDAAHNSFVRSKKLNGILLYAFDLLGASGYIWKHKHIYSHHPHVNIPNMDNDIKESKLLRLAPKTEWLSNHRFQHIYMPFLYFFYTLFWLLFRDFRDFFETDSEGKSIFRHDLKEYFILFIVKFIFVGRMLILPALILPFTFGQILAGFFCFHFVASFTVALPLVSAHVGEHAKFPEPNEEGEMANSWVRHQLITTTDFATNNTLVTHMFGGFNHHVAHHLFPDVCYIHYPELTQILKSTCEEYNMPYADNPTMLKAVWSHLKFLKLQGMEGNSVEYIDM